MGATDARKATTWGIRLRFLVRMLGITGLAAATAGGVMLDLVVRIADWSVSAIRTACSGEQGGFAEISGLLLVLGAAAVVLALAVEMTGALMLMTGRRTAANSVATVASVAAVALVILVNVISFTHHARFDLTRDHRYTLPADLVEKLRALRPATPTTIVVLQMHNTYGGLAEKRDAYTSEGERVVTEKVKDLVDEFREFGPRFNVVVLDTEAFGYKRTLDDLTRDAPELKSAINSSPENSIFFHVRGHVQRLAFNEFLQLDMTASEEAEGGRGNLVLRPQGVETFARRVLSVQERRPKVALAVIHELLTSAYPEGQRGRVYTLAGLKDVLTSHGYDVVDIVLKNWTGARSLDDLKPTAYSLEEAKLERYEGDLGKARRSLAAINRKVYTLERVQEAVEGLKSAPWPRREAAYRQLIGGLTVTEENERDVLDILAKQLAKARDLREEARKKATAAAAAVAEAFRNEKTVEDGKETDAKTKLSHRLADVDLLIIPRFTVEDATEGEGPDVPSNYHALRPEQIEVIRDFMKSGKPVLACLGPVSGPDGPMLDGQDGLERLIAERGVTLGQETILFDVEQKAYAARIAGDQFGGAVSAEVPPLVIAEKSAGGSLQLTPNPIGEAFHVTSRGLGQSLNLRKKALRPVALAPGWESRLPFAAEFLLTGVDCWNEERPFKQSEVRRTPDGRLVPTVVYVPEFEATSVADPRWGTPRAVRRGPFCVGLAIDGPIPAAWVNQEYEREQFVAAMLSAGMPADPVLAAGLTVAARQLERKNERLVVFGSGNLFMGPKLEPAEQELLLHSVNWLAGRSDRLPRTDLPSWSYPRVALSERETALWERGAAFGLPLLAVFLGVMAMMIRRWR